MTVALLAGIDLSVRRLDAALIPLDPDHGSTCPVVLFRSAEIPQEADRSQRFRLRRLVHHLLLGDGWGPWDDVASVWVEEPRGPFAARQLNAVYGAVLSSIPLRMAATGIDPQSWRRALGLPRGLSKQEALVEARRYADPIMVADEHAADALLVALAGREILLKGAAA